MYGSVTRWTLICDMEWLFILRVFCYDGWAITIVHLVTASGVNACMQ